MTAVRAWRALPPSLRTALAAGAMVVTPNKRLARRLAAQSDDAQREAGRAVWPAPVVVPWEAWLQRLWLDVLATPAEESPSRLYTPAHRAYVWRRIVAAEGLSLIDEDGAAALAIEAWTLVHAWGTGAPSWRGWAGGDDDCAAFARWADDYSRVLAGAGALDSAQLPDWLAAQAAGVIAWRGMPVVLAGFIELSPQQERLLAALGAAGMTIDRSATVRDVAGSASRVDGGTPRDEVRVALQWACDRALADPDERIGIAIEDFASRKEEIRALADEILCPALQWPGHEEADRPYSLSLGSAVSDVPLIAAAIDLLGLVHGGLPMPRAAALLRSPYLSGAPGDWLRRAERERTWLREGRREVSFDDAINALAEVDDALADRWRRARGELRRPANATPREWTEFWRAWLAATGWPGERALTSAEWQARRAWDDVFGAFATLGAVERRIAAGAAFAALASAARDHVFQPESAHAQIEIMGVLEATGLPLDALWVAGLAAEVWPPAPRPNPMLPISWQRERGVPRSSAARELEYSRAMTAQWVHGASEVVFSYASRVDDHRRSMSLLVPAVPSQTDFAKLPATTAAVQQRSAPALEYVVDDRMPSLPMGSAVSGGAALIEAQSDCPFRASARYRLQVDIWPAPVSGLSAMERGNLVHAALAGFWRDVGDHSTLVAMSPEALTARVDEAAAVAIAEVPAARWRRVAAAVRSGEERRIASIVRAWLDDVERSRPPFTVDAIEASHSIGLGGLDLKLRLDRVDALDDGGSAIIDYKTGLATSPARWFDERPQAPQVGLYVIVQRALAPDRPVRAATYAQLKPGEICLKGIAADAEAWPALPLPAVVGDAGLPDWPAVVDRWAQSLGALASEVRDGYSAVTPRDLRDTCKRCGLQPLCRIGAMATEDKAGGDDA